MKKDMYKHLSKADGEKLLLDLLKDGIINNGKKIDFKKSSKYVSRTFKDTEKIFKQAFISKE